MNFEKRNACHWTFPLKLASVSISSAALSILKWILFVYVLLSSILPLTLSEKLLNFGFNTRSYRNPCDSECKCYSWKSKYETESRNRFTVNCSVMQFGLFQGLSIPKNLPFNTTDLLVAEYHLGTLGIDSFDNNQFPLNPVLLTIVLRNCHITYLSRETFQANSLVSVEIIDLNHNTVELVQEGTFVHLPYVENISMFRNGLQKVENGAFRNLPKARTINLSNNIISEIYPGTFDNIPQLKFLDLSNNWLTNLPWRNISQLPSLQELGLKGNFWNCTCDMEGILSVNRSLLAGTNAKCLYPKFLNGTLLEQLTSKDFSYCFNKNTSPMRSIVTICCGVTVLVLYLIYEYYNYIQTHRRVGQIEYDIKNVLGHSGDVFQGKLKDGRKAAIKKRSRLTWNCKELDILLHLSEKGPPHPNIVQYLCVEHNSRYTYLALELCEGNLMAAVNDHSEWFAGDLELRKCFLQLGSGLSHLHKLGIQHRDIKPQNILWKRTADVVRFVISDFDLGQFSEDESLHKVKCGTLGWIAPELWNREERTNAVDIFSLGCVFYFVATLGGHPFGPISDMKSCQHCIISQNYFTLSGFQADRFKDFLNVAFMAEDLIGEMILFTPADRLTASDILDHPLLWSSSQMLKFFHMIGDCVDDELNPSIVAFKEMLESEADTVFGESWMDKLHKAIRGDVKGFKKKKGELCSLLRVVRNKIEHFDHMGDELRKIYSGIREGVVQYFVNCFPRLVSYTYRTLLKSGLEYRDELIKIRS